jgi:outer membrane protein assembly factor BamB
MNALLWRSVLLALFAVGSFAALTPREAKAQATAPAAGTVKSDDEEEEESSEEEQKPAAPQNPDEMPARVPQTGFSVRKEDPKVADALEDFRRHSQKKAWELAFKALASVVEKDPKGMVPAGDGMMVPTRRRVWQALATLPADGREAYRLFNDAVAKQKFEKATTGSTGDDVGALRELFNTYFITSVGDDAADRLGDACFEAGDFLAADAAWKSVLDHYPDTNLSKTRLRLKRCVALSRASRWDAFEEVAASLGPDGAAETVRVAGEQRPAGQFVASLREGARKPAEQLASASQRTESNDPLQLPQADKPAWQVKFMDESVAQRLEQALNNMGWGGEQMPVSAAVPPSATDGKRVYLNWLGIAFAVDARTGKLVWRSRKFSDLSNQAQQLVYGGVNPARYHLALHGDKVYVTGLPLDQPNMGFSQTGGTYRMVCHNAENGSVAWSTKSGDLAGYNVASEPVIVGDTLYVVASRVNQQELHLLAATPDKGKLQWSVPLGTPQVGVDYRGMQQGPSPMLLQHAGMVYVVTNNGGVLAVDTAGRRLEWAFSCEPPPVMSGYVMFIPNNVRKPPVKTPGAAFIRDSVLYFKESGGYAVYALDLAGPSLKWKRTADPSDTIAAVGRDSLLMVGEDVSSIDLNSRAMRWSTSLPVETGMLRTILGGDRLYVFSGRGVFQLDTASGDPAGKPFRGADLESMGGALYRCNDRLVAVSNLAVTAYPLPTAGVRQSSAQ